MRHITPHKLESVNCREWFCSYRREDVNTKVPEVMNASGKNWSEKNAAIMGSVDRGYLKPHNGEKEKELSINFITQSFARLEFDNCLGWDCHWLAVLRIFPLPLNSLGC